MSLSSGRIYAVQHSDGIVKFGVATNVKMRWNVAYQERKVKQISFIASPLIDDLYRLAERKLLKRAKRILVLARGREFFYCNDFGIAENLIRQTHREFSSEAIGWRKYINISPYVRRSYEWLNNRFTLPTVHIYTQIPGKLQITHRRTKKTAIIDESILQNWCLEQFSSQLRKELSPTEKK